MTGTGGEATAPSLLRRVMRNWFLWSFVVGAALVTLSVPIFRRVPPAPAPIAPMPEWSLTDSTGASVTSASLRGRTYVMAITSAACAHSQPHGPCGRVGTELAELGRQFAALHADVPVLSVDVDEADAVVLGHELGEAQLRAEKLRAAETTPTGRVALTGSRDAVCALVAGSLALVRKLSVPCGRLHALAHDPHALIVDGEGRIRASIDIDSAGAAGPGLDETLHRSLAVVEGRPFEPANGL